MATPCHTPMVNLDCFPSLNEYIKKVYLFFRKQKQKSNDSVLIEWLKQSILYTSLLLRKALTIFRRKVQGDIALGIQYYPHTPLKYR
jgi:hypothetical protein